MPATRHRVTTLLDLPPEILTAVLKSLLPVSIDSVRATLYVCKQLYVIALPLSVHTYRSLSPAEDEEDYEQILAFLRYITITKPFLAPLVKRIAVGNFLSRWIDEKREQTRQLPAAERNTYQEILRKVSTQGKLQGGEEWVQQVLRDLESDFEEAVIVLLLAACHGLEELYYGVPTSRNLFGQVVRAASAAARNASEQGLGTDALALSNLRSVHHESEDHKYGCYCFVEPAALLFALPTLSSYECIGASSASDVNAHFVEMPRGTSAVEHIILRNGNVSPKALKAIVGACTALRSFSYSRIFLYNFNGDIDAPDLIETMLPHAETLELLELKYHPSFQYSRRCEPENRYLGVKLKKLHALKTLKAGSQWLMAIADTRHALSEDSDERPSSAPRLVECLPENLEHLEIYDCGKAVLDQLQELLDSFADASPHSSRLRSVRLLFNEKTIQSQEITLKCNALGICVEAFIQSTKQERYHRRGEDTTQSEDGFISNLCTRIHGEITDGEWLFKMPVGIRVGISGTGSEDENSANGE